MKFYTEIPNEVFIYGEKAIHFRGNELDTDDKELIEVLKKHYSTNAVQSVSEYVEPKTESPDLGEMTRNELIQLAETKGIKDAGRMNKSRLIEALGVE